jgi:hypothetical protein
MPKVYESFSMVQIIKKNKRKHETTNQFKFFCGVIIRPPRMNWFNEYFRFGNGTDSRGILFSHGNEWSEQRRFALRSLRFDFSFIFIGAAKNTNLLNLLHFQN